MHHARLPDIDRNQRGGKKPVLVDAMTAFFAGSCPETAWIQEVKNCPCARLPQSRASALAAFHQEKMWTGGIGV